MTSEPASPADAAGAQPAASTPAVAPAAASPAPAPAQTVAPAQAAAAPVLRLPALTQLAIGAALLASLAALGLAGKLWSDAGQLHNQVSKQMADMHLQSRESNTVARMANDQSRDATTKVALLEGKMAELNAQRTQLDGVLQSLAKAKEETLLADVDAAIQLGMQQSQLTGSVQPMLAALLSAEKRLASSSQPQLQNLHQAIQQDIDRLKRTNVSDVPALAGKIDTVVRQLDNLPLLANTVPAVGKPALQAPAAVSEPRSQAATSSWQAWWQQLRQGMAGLVRVRPIDNRDAALLQPEQGYYLREHLKLRLLNARMALLARQPELGKGDIAAAKAQIGKYFDPASAAVKTTLATLDEVLQQTYAAELPAITDTLKALVDARTAPAIAAPAIAPGARNS